MTATTLVDRSILRLSGEDVRGFLQGLVTHDLALLTPERPLWAGLLTAQGKVLFDFILWADGEDVLIDCEAEAAGELARRLTLYRLRRKIAIEPVQGLAVHWAVDPSPFGLSLSKPRLAPMAGSEGNEGLRQARDERMIGPAPDPRLTELGRRWLAAPGDPARGWVAHRLSLGVTEGREELGSDKTLWLECNAAELDGVSFTKGCYVGQENTARMNYRSKVNRRLVVVAAAAPGERTRAHYPELGLAVEHRRVEDLGAALVPDWLAEALRPGTDPST